MAQAGALAEPSNVSCRSESSRSPFQLVDGARPNGESFNWNISLAPSEEPLPTTARGGRERIEWYAEKRKAGISRRHYLEIRRVLSEAADLLEQVGRTCHPERFGEPELDALLNGGWRPATSEQVGLAPRTRAYNVCLLNGFLKAHNNLVVENRHLHFPNVGVRRRDYLKPDQGARLLTIAETLGIQSHAAVALQMLMGLRRCEMLRVRTTELDLGLFPEALRVHGSLKGQSGEKVRRVPWHDEVRRIVPELLAHRTQESRGLRGPDSGFVFVHRTSEGLRVWSKSYVDRAWMEPAFDSAGIKRPDGLNHVLRRTFGRTLWDHGVPIEKVAYLMGHEDTRETKKYLGLNEEDALESMRVLNRVFPARTAA
jgi:integrase